MYKKCLVPERLVHIEYQTYFVYTLIYKKFFVLKRLVLIQY